MQRFLYALAMALVLIIPTVQTPAIAQSEGVRVSAEAVSGQLGPGYGMGLRFTVINETSAPVIVTDFTFADVVDSTGDGLELCPRV